MANAEMTKEQMEEILELKPELRDSIIEALDAKIEHYQQLKVAAGGSGAKTRRGGTRAPNPSGLKHAEAVLRSLGKKEMTSVQIRKEAAEKFGHEFGNSLGTTLNNMCAKRLLDYARIEGGKHFMYSATPAPK